MSKSYSVTHLLLHQKGSNVSIFKLKGLMGIGVFLVRHAQLDLGGSEVCTSDKAVACPCFRTCFSDVSSVGRLERRPTHSTKLSHVVKFKFGSERPQDKEFPDSQGQERFLYNMATYGNWRLNNLTLHAHAGVTWAVSATSVASAPQQNVTMWEWKVELPARKYEVWRGMKILQADLHQFQATSSACDFWISILSIWPFVLDISWYIPVFSSFNLC